MSNVDGDDSLGSTGDALPTADEPSVLTVDDVATLLRLERKTIYGAVSRGEIPGARRIGRAIRFSRSAVLEWLRTGQGRVSRSRRIG